MSPLSDKPESEPSPALCSLGMLAELFRVPLSTVRGWYQRGWIQPTVVQDGVPLFQRSEVLSAQRLSELRRNGLRADKIAQKLKGLRALSPEERLSLSSKDLIIQDGNIVLRQDGRLLESTGQELLNFDDAPEGSAEKTVPGTETDGLGLTLNWIFSRNQLSEEEIRLADAAETTTAQPAVTLEEMRRTLGVLSEMGCLKLAEEVCRNVLFMAEPNAADACQLGKLLCLQGNLLGAKERFFSALELDPQCSEAHEWLARVLTDLGESELVL